MRDTPTLNLHSVTRIEVSEIYRWSPAIGESCRVLTVYSGDAKALEIELYADNTATLAIIAGEPVLANGQPVEVE